MIIPSAIWKSCIAITSFINGTGGVKRSFRSCGKPSLRYRRYRCCCDFEDYAEAVIVKKVNRWMKQNNRYYYRYLSLDKPFVDSEETMLSTYIAADDMFCSIELYDFISRLSFIKYAVCKGYILQYFDEEIAYKLHITLKQLEEIKLELQQDFTVGYLL